RINRSKHFFVRTGSDEDFERVVCLAQLPDRALQLCGVGDLALSDVGRVSLMTDERHRVSDRLSPIGEIHRLPSRTSRKRWSSSSIAARAVVASTPTPSLCVDAPSSLPRSRSTASK